MFPAAADTSRPGWKMDGFWEDPNSNFGYVLDKCPQTNIDDISQVQNSKKCPVCENRERHFNQHVREGKDRSKGMQRLNFDLITKWLRENPVGETFDTATSLRG